MTTAIIDQLSSLIKSPALERLDLTLCKPNLFEILRISHNEIRHSNFLAWMLDPQQSHNLGDTFLKWFLKDVFSDQRVTWINEFKVDSLDTNDLVIHREYKNIDLLLETSQFVVIIENKLWSKEHSNQLNRYKTTVEKEFQAKHHAFVFLTPYAEAPEQDSDKDIYVTFDYESIVRILDIILETYGHSISEKVRTYINDYIAVVRRYVMQDDEAISIAQEIYKNHKGALDFIFESKPDRLLEVVTSFNNAVEKAGYVLGSPGKGYCRFLTQKLSAALPVTTMPGWKFNEPFSFEIRFHDGKVYFTCVVSPGSEPLREMLIAALKKVDGAKSPKGKKWSTVHNHTHRININDEKHDDLDVLLEDLERMMSKEKVFIENVEAEILNHLKKHL
jgi:hypothetical protein